MGNLDHLAHLATASFTFYSRYPYFYHAFGKAAKIDLRLAGSSKTFYDPLRGEHIMKNTPTNSTTASQLASKTAVAYADHPHVRAIALGGSLAAGRAGPGSDIDLYV
jgi:hypothetical protein